MSIKRLVVVVGATGSGKTDLSILLARHYCAPILSMDSRQMYCGMPIGTAQPTIEQQQEANHYFINSHDLKSDLNCGEYEKQALKVLENLFIDHDIVVAVGGSGLYIKALCEGMDDLPTADSELRERLSQRLKTEGVATLAEELRQLDPDYYAVVDRQNPARVVRALEVCLQTGRPFSEQRTGGRVCRPFEVVKVGVDMPREELYSRINRRVDQMVADGLEMEVRTLLPYRQLNALQTVGYRELFDYFDGTTTFDEAVELVKRNSRRYAKRQLTWFRRDEVIRWFHPAQVAEIIAYVDSPTHLCAESAAEFGKS